MLSNSSGALELWHKYPKSNKFLYFNDDVALLRPICLSDFYSPDDGYVLYPKLAITPYGTGEKFRKKCSEFCRTVYGDGKCHQQCNRAECLYEGGDCDQHPETDDNDTREAYHKSVDYVNYLLDRKFK